MIENVVTCDRCKKRCEGTIYYTVNIYGHDINPTNDGRVSASTATQNVDGGLKKLFSIEKHYCESCKDKFEEFLTMDDSKNVTFRTDYRTKQRIGSGKRLSALLR